MIKPELKKLNFANPIHFLSLGFLSGLAPKAPGTFGTLAAIPVVYAMVQLNSVWLFALITLLSSLIGCYLCGYTAKALNTHDHPAIVWDEVVGLMITFGLVPLGLIPFDWFSLVMGFVLFRFFDILKPWPIKWADTHVEGGLGIMLDDVIAGFMSMGCLYLIYLFI